MPGLPLISVVIPVYGVEEYLPACLDSVLGPPGRVGDTAAGDTVGPEIEVIAVDDASPDGCAALLDARAAADPRLRVVHLAVNGGPGPARNAGLARATGEYVWFVDADDTLTAGALAAAAAALRPAGPGPGPDVLLVGWAAHYDGTDPAGGADAGQDILARVPAGGTTLARMPELAGLTMTSWSKLLRREFLAGAGVGFGAGIHEDVIVTCAALLAAESVAALPRVCYRYRRDRRGQFMGTPGPAHWAIFGAYRQVFDRAAAAGASPAVRAALFGRAIWHYTTLFQASRAWPGRGSLIPRRARRAFFARMHAEYTARRPPGYRRPAGPRGLKFALIERGWYAAYLALEPVNQLRVAAGARLRRGAGPG